MKVKKSVKKQPPPAQDVLTLIGRIADASEQDLPVILTDFQAWRYARGDLHAWIPVLDRFDAILADIVSSYDLSKVQTNEFTPKTKELVLEILRVQRLLLENCTSRKLFASYDRLFDFLCSLDLDVLQASLYTLLRPAQQYGAQTPFELNLGPDLCHRLLTLSRGWDKLQPLGVSLAAYASQEDLSLPDSHATIQFYSSRAGPSRGPTFSSPGAKAGEAASDGLTILDLKSVLDGPADCIYDRLSLLAEENGIPLGDQLVAVNRLRLSRPGDKSQRRKLLVIRLLALATYVYIAPEDTANSLLFLFEPDLVAHIAGLLQPSNRVGDHVSASAMLALDACARHRSRMAEVLASLNANANHGAVISLARDTISRLDPSDAPPYELVDAVLSFIAFIATSPAHGNMLLGAGILPVLLDVTRTSSSRRDSYIPRACGLIDSIVYSNPQAMPLFNNVDGVNALVSCIKNEIDLYERMQMPLASDTMSEETIKTYTTSPLRAVLRSVHRLMQSSGGTEGLRNLVDSDLPKSLKRIFEVSSTFGPRVFSLAINIMATFVHNEPTSLGTLQELQLPQTLYSDLEANMPASSDVICAIPNAIGAVCLSQSGLAYTVSHPTVLDKLLDAAVLALTEEASTERDNLQTVGSNIDELVRHHPSLRPIVLTAIFRLLRRARDEGQTFIPDTSEECHYVLTTTAPSYDSVKKPAVNPHLAAICRIFKVLEGLMRNTAMCKEFIQDGGLEILFEITDLPCIPLRFIGFTDAATSLTHVLRVIGDHDHVELVKHLVQSAQSILIRTDASLHGQNIAEDWLQLEANQSVALEGLKASLSLAIRLSYLSEILVGLSWSHARVATSFIKALGVSTGSDFVLNLGHLHRRCVRAHVAFHTASPEDVPGNRSPSEVIGPEDTPQSLAPTSGAKFVVHRLHVVLTAFFKAAIKLLFTKRNAEPTHQKEAVTLADCITGIIKGYLQETPSQHAIGIDTLAVGLATTLLFDERGSDGHLNVVLLLSFAKEHGLEDLWKAFRRIVGHTDQAFSKPEMERTEDDKATLLNVTAGLRVSLLAMSGLVSPRSLMENAQAHALLQRQSSTGTEPQPLFDPSTLFVKIRLGVFPITRHIWTAKWLASLPHPLIKLVCTSYLAVMEGKSESPSNEPVLPSVPQPIRRQPIVADPARIDQLADMGFPRTSAEYALIRARNNVAAAADLILSMPHLFQDDLPPPAAEAALRVPEPTVESTEETTQGNLQPSLDGPKLRESLASLRDEFRADLADRALVVLDVAPDLVFALLPAFSADVNGAALLLNAIEVLVSAPEPRVIARLRLFVIFVKAHRELSLSSSDVRKAGAILKALSKSPQTRAPWTVAVLLFAEAVFALSSYVTAAKLGDEAQKAVVEELLDEDYEHWLIPVCLDILQDTAATREETMSALRLAVYMTRRSSPFELSLASISPFRTPTTNLIGCHPYAAMILRHSFEDQAVLKDIMRTEIRMWFTPARNKVADITHFVRQMRHLASRNPIVFVQSVEAECALVDPSPPQSVFHIRLAKNEHETPETSDFLAAEDREHRSLMDAVLSECGKALLIAREASSETSGQAPLATAYVGCILALLTELVGSYMAAKNAFLSSLRHNGLYTAQESRPDLSVLVNDLICAVNLRLDLSMAAEAARTEASTRRLNVASWTTSLLVGLCADPTGTKRLPDDVVSARRSVLDAIVKALKDSGTGEPSARYGRLWALGELIYRLLVAKVSTLPPKQDETNQHMAKVMLEKNVVSVLTGITGNLDLNYPDINVVLASLLRALEYLTKVSVKWGKTERTSDGTKPDDGLAPSISSEEESDIDMSDNEEEAPDLYRNSALGIIGADADLEDEEESEDEDEEDEDMMEAFSDDMIDDVMDDDDTNTAPSTDEEHGGEALDHDDWSDQEGDREDEDDEDEDLEQGAVIGDPAEEELSWDVNPEIEADSVLSTEEEGRPLGDDFQDGQAFFAEDGDEDEDDDIEMGDEEGVDDIDVLEPILTANQTATWGGSNDIAGHLGWVQAHAGHIRGVDGRRRSRLSDTDPAAAILFGPPHRQHIPTNPAQHPLLTDPSNHSPTSRRIPRGVLAGNSGLNDLLAHLEAIGGPQASRFFENVLAQTGYGGPEAIRVNLEQSAEGAIGLSVGGRSITIPPVLSRSSRPTLDDVTSELAPQPTIHRWHEESNIHLRGTDQTPNLVKHLVNRLMPVARKAAEDEAERVRKTAAEEEVAAIKTKEMEIAAAAAIALPQSRNSPAPASLTDVEMGEPLSAADPGREPRPSSVPPVTSATALESLARTVIQIRGEDIDITDAGIDLEFLQALPDDMRADVIEQHLREQNRLSQRPPAGAPQSTSQISPEFLEALPPEIRAEVVMQEALETARRARTQASSEVIVPPASDAAAGFLASLSDELRDVMMLGPSGEVTGHLPQRSTVPKPTADEPPTKKARREAVQLLERPGVASLLRLLFFPDAFRKGYLFQIFVNLCENSTTRADLLGLLLSIIQDGAADIPAVDKSFQEMSIRAFTTPRTTPQVAKGPEAPTPSVSLFAHLHSEHAPAFIAQRCFQALSHIVGANSRAVEYFLIEHERLVGLRKPPSKKGKGKEKGFPQTKFPVVVLISLLDRPTLLKTTGMMETLTGLLATITKPLASLKPVFTLDLKAREPPLLPSLDSTSAPANIEGNVSDGAQPNATLRAPYIPPGVLRLLVNCLTTGECNSRTFSQTLAVMQHLCTTSEAKDILLLELRTRSQDLGNTLEAELRALCRHLSDSDTGIDMATLTQCCPPSSDQAQLLRLLKTIEYLHLSKADSDAPAGVLSDEEQAVAKAFALFEFEALWKQLGECLSLVEIRGKEEQIASLLLPLVEALMVVCKYGDRAAREIRSPSVPPDIGDLFASFTFAHRKVLNAIVRTNPALLSGSFALLVRNPRVLDFDNKRTWFFQKLKRKRDQAVPSGVLHLNVRRQYIFEDSYHALRQRTGDEIKYGKLSVKFYHEDGIDAGGVTREWYSVLAQQIFDPNFALFEPCAADHQTYQPSKASAVNGEHLAYFKFVGRIIGKAVYDGRLLDAYFNRAFYKQILGRAVDIRDLESIDPEYHKSLQWMLDNDITGVIDQEFTIEDDQFGEKKTVELKEGGIDIPVTEENKEDYVRLVVSYRLDNSIQSQIIAFLEGFYDVIPRHLVQIFEPDQLELLISGITTIDVDELKNATQLSGWKASDPEISWFWRALRSFSQEERARFLMFVTSSSRVPLGGFTQLQGASGIQPFQMQQLYAKEGSLPQASTCFNLLLLPKYASYEQLREKLQFAVVETGGFGKS